MSNFKLTFNFLSGSRLIPFFCLLISLFFSSCDLFTIKLTGEFYPRELSNHYWSLDNQRISFLYSNLLQSNPSGRAVLGYYVGFIDVKTKKHKILKVFNQRGDDASNVELFGWTSAQKLLLRITDNSSQKKLYTLDQEGLLASYFDNESVNIPELDWLSPLPNESGFIGLSNAGTPDTPPQFYYIKNKQFERLKFEMPSDLIIPIKKVSANLNQASSESQNNITNTQNHYAELSPFVLNYLSSDLQLATHFTGTIQKPAADPSHLPSYSEYHYFAEIDLKTHQINRVQKTKSNQYSSVSLIGSSLELPKLNFLGWLSENELLYAETAWIQEYDFWKNPINKTQIKYLKYNLLTQTEKVVTLKDSVDLNKPYHSTSVISPDQTRILSNQSLKLYLYDIVSSKSELLFDSETVLPKGAYHVIH